jgi:hypothetical protein
MNGVKKGLLVGALQVLLVCTLGAKLLYDRATRPRVWVRVATYDPELPIRGRYLAFNVQVPLEGFTVREHPEPYANPFSPDHCDLELRNGVSQRSRIRMASSGSTAESSTANPSPL